MLIISVLFWCEGGLINSISGLFRQKNSKEKDDQSDSKASLLLFVSALFIPNVMNMGNYLLIYYQLEHIFVLSHLKGSKESSAGCCSNKRLANYVRIIFWVVLTIFFLFEVTFLLLVWF